MESIISKQFGELKLAFTTRLQLRWNTQGTGKKLSGPTPGTHLTIVPGKYEGSFYHPVVPEGFYALGSVVERKLNDAAIGSEVDGDLAALLVGGTVGNLDDGAPLAYPTKYERIWNTDKMDSKHKGACWRPIAPRGYVALGDVFTNSHKTAPALTDVVCVRASSENGVKPLVYRAQVDGKAIYDTSDCNTDKHFSAWRVVVPDPYSGSEGVIAALTFRGKTGRSAPDDSDPVFVLKLPFPADHSDSHCSPPIPTDYRRPADFTDPVELDRVYVPFTVVRDTAPIDEINLGRISPNWQVANSPFYSIRRYFQYHNVFSHRNDKSVDTDEVTEQLTSGVEDSKSETFTKTTGITVNTSSGIQIGAISLDASAEVSRELGYEKTTSSTRYRETTRSILVKVAPQTRATLYADRHVLQTHRYDGTLVGSELEFDTGDSYLSVQYPPGDPNEPVVKVSAAELALGAQRKGGHEEVPLPLP